MKNIVVSGSVAYDYIMDYKGQFKDNIKADNLDNLSVGFLINYLKKEMGGTGLNISYNLSLLGEKPILLASIGNDFIFDGFFQEKVNLEYVYKSKKLLSASGYIINDNKGGQITAFYPGAMDKAIETSINDIAEEIAYSIVSPNQKEAMLKHLKESNKLGLKVFFDPGQQLFIFSKDELLEAVKYSNYLIVNSYEYNEFKSRIGKTETELLKLFEMIIITKGEEGSTIIGENEKFEIPVVKVTEVVDSTGAGDAYRAGLIRGLKLGYNWAKAGRLGSLVSSHCVQFHGAQSHFIVKSNLEEQYKEIFGEDIDLYKERKIVLN